VYKRQGYTADPQENILYVDKHDNETLFDNNIYKAPADTPMSVRVRMQALANAFVMYGQGVPFFQAGTDLLRSKSLDRNSYNSGDWFNRLDWTYQTNNFGVGLPPAADNQNEWERMRPFLANPANVPAPEDIQLSAAIFQDMLRVRASTPLFRLRTGDDVRQRVSFPIVADQPNVIVYAISDTAGADLDPNYDGVLVIFNTSSASVSVALPDLAEAGYVLHPVLASGADADMQTASAAGGVFSVPPYSAAVFVAPQN
jgi:pullulanase/glycogen debranching enzyme